jgi:hypothetical protein
MAERIPEPLEKNLADRLAFYSDIGIQLFYKQRNLPAQEISPLKPVAPASAVHEEMPLPKPAPKPAPQKFVAPPAPPSPPPKFVPPLKSSAPSLFEAVNKVSGDTLLKTSAIALVASSIARVTLSSSAMETRKQGSSSSAKAQEPMKTPRAFHLSAAPENSSRK